MNASEPWISGGNIVLESEDQKQVPDPSLKLLCPWAVYFISEASVPLSGAWLAPLVEHVILDLGVVSSSPMLGENLL